MQLFLYRRVPQLTHAQVEYLNPEGVRESPYEHCMPLAYKGTILYSVQLPSSLLATPRVGSVIHSLHEPAYNLGISEKATVNASRLCAAVTPEPQ
jgi:hypothetical protein